jgi:poly(A) polymerase
MIRRLLSRLLPLVSEPRRYAVDEHGIRRESLSPAALNVAKRLNEAGYSAFVVGGAVRDLLFGIPPKDFDIATDATPEQVKPLFRRAFIIGRRFRLVHVLSGGETIEVSTFRGPQNAEGNAADEHGRLLSDNVFGTQAEDAVRRDFTINALYYDAASETVVDFVGGMKDMKARRLKLIGAPMQRYREDPVRMLRAIRLAAKLGASIDKKTEAPILKLAPLIQNVPAPRLFDEMLKLLLSGHASEALASLREHGLHHGMLPMLDVIVEQPRGQRFIELALANTDTRIREGKPVSPAFLFATLLWHEVLTQWEAATAQGARSVPALMDAMDRVLEQQAEKIAIPRRYGAAMKEIWALQPRFEQRSGQRPFRLVEQARFRAGYDFLLLRCEGGEVSSELGEWWTQFQQVDTEERSRMLVQETAPKPRRRRKPRRKAEPAEGAATTEPQS